MIQVFWYKRTKKRVFLMAPIHHHFEQLGWKETTVVARFRIVAVVCAVIGLFRLFLTEDHGADLFPQQPKPRCQLVVDR